MTNGGHIPEPTTKVVTLQAYFVVGGSFRLRDEVIAHLRFAVLVTGCLFRF